MPLELWIGLFSALAIGAYVSDRHTDRLARMADRLFRLRGPR